MDGSLIQVFRIERTSKVKKKHGLKTWKDVFASSLILLKFFWDIYIFSPWAFKHVAQKMKLVESKHEYSKSKVLRSSEVTFHFKCIVLWL
jgi:hypothetical protein